MIVWFKVIVSEDNSTEFYKNNSWLFLLYKQGDHLEKTSQFISNAIHLTSFTQDNIHLYILPKNKEIDILPWAKQGWVYISYQYSLVLGVMWDSQEAI